MVNFRQGLYQEAIYISSCRKTKELGSDVCPLSQVSMTSGQPTPNLNSAEDPTFMKQSDSSKIDCNIPSINDRLDGKPPPKKLNSSLPVTEKQQGKENQISTNVSRNGKQSPLKRVPRVGVAAKGNKQADALVTTLFNYSFIKIILILMFLVYLIWIVIRVPDQFSQD